MTNNNAGAELTPFSVVDCLDTDEMIAAYLVAMLDDPESDPAAELASLRSAVGDVIQALRKRRA